MKKLILPSKFILPAIIFSFKLLSATAQSFPCDSFCVESIKMDSAQKNMLDVVLYNESSVFIDFPYLQVISNKDTVANKSKTVEYFGQLAKTKITYTTSTTLTSVPSNFTCTVFLKSAIEGDSCVLSYPCSAATSLQAAAKHDFIFSIFPDPVNAMLNIEAGEAIEYPFQIRIFTIAGKEMLREDINTGGRLYSVNVSHFPAGIYTISLNSNKSVYKGKFLKE